VTGIQPTDATDPFRKSEPLARGSPPCIILSDDYRSYGAFR
jgi:hypothetical protein